MTEEANEIETEVSASTATEYRRYPTAKFYASVILMLGRFVVLTLAISVAISLSSALPDIDLKAEPFLHHRSIVTHSILLPGLLFLALHRSMVARGFIAILFAALSIHLFADVLSPPVGYGQIWLPLQDSLSLGPLSPIFLWANAALAMLFAISIASQSLRSEIAGASLFSGMLYGLMSEQSYSSAAFIVLMLVAAIWMQVWRGKMVETPRKMIMDFRMQRDVDLARNRDYAAAEREAWQNTPWLRRCYLNFRFFVIGLYTIARWILSNPAKAAFSFSLISAISISLYLLSIAPPQVASGDPYTGLHPRLSLGAETGEESVINSLARGLRDAGRYVWVKHGSGGWIATDGGKYVPGTLRALPPD